MASTPRKDSRLHERRIQLRQRLRRGNGPQKGRDRSDPGSWRPITLLNTVAKLGQKVVADILQTKHELFQDQHNSRPSHLQAKSTSSPQAHPAKASGNANLDRDSGRSLRSSSLVASVASFVDFYRPKFALLENVHRHAQDRIKKKDGLPYNVFSQLLCAVVAIGYQCQQFTLDAWLFGSCQTRTRLFVSIAAPGLRLPP
ncbi:hypothetical protein BDZ91DRAFT_798479 [Kalaharituber pfeilii]|nr:hypothetical protein BDZ91DRAFT_798479 [Kalaharituber pfeilii]